jgi:hypothetical protein
LFASAFLEEKRIEEKRRVKYRRNKEKTSSAEEEKESSNSYFLGVSQNVMLLFQSHVFLLPKRKIKKVWVWTFVLHLTCFLCFSLPNDFRQT